MYIHLILNLRTFFLWLRYMALYIFRRKSAWIEVAFSGAEMKVLRYANTIHECSFCLIKCRVFNVKNQIPRHLSCLGNRACNRLFTSVTVK